VLPYWRLRLFGLTLHLTYAMAELKLKPSANAAQASNRGAFIGSISKLSKVQGFDDDLSQHSTRCTNSLFACLMARPSCRAVPGREACYVIRVKACLTTWKG